MTREEKIRNMMENYIQKRDRSKDITIMEFHRRHLLLFMNRFCQFLARFSTPSSSLLSHEIFLVVEAATLVAKTDWDKLGRGEMECGISFTKYFAAFDQLAAGLGQLDKQAALCVESLTISCGSSCD
jgi:hypothetical protein